MWCGEADVAEELEVMLGHGGALVLTHREGLVEEEEMALGYGRCWGLSGVCARLVLGCKLLEVQEVLRERAKSALRRQRCYYIGVELHEGR